MISTSQAALAGACVLGLSLTGCPGAAPSATPGPTASATAPATPASTPLTNAVLLGTWVDTDPKHEGFSFKFTEDRFVIQMGGTEQPLRYEVVGSTTDTITIVTHEELLGTDETKDLRITYRPVGSDALERLAKDGLDAGTLTRQGR